MNGNGIGLRCFGVIASAIRMNHQFSVVFFLYLQASPFSLSSHSLSISIFSKTSSSITLSKRANIILMIYCKVPLELHYFHRLQVMNHWKSDNNIFPSDLPNESVPLVSFSKLLISFCAGKLAIKGVVTNFVQLN